MDDYTRFVSDVARRFRGRIKGYVIWNEPNLSFEWGGRAPDPASYTDMLCEAYHAIKSADPDALVVSAGLAPTNQDDAEAMNDRRFLEGMLEAGAADCFDVLGAHPTVSHTPRTIRATPMTGSTWRVSRIYAISWLSAAPSQTCVATEMGWTVNAVGESAWQTVTLQQQAEYLRTRSSGSDEIGRG